MNAKWSGVATLDWPPRGRCAERIAPSYPSRFAGVFKIIPSDGTYNTKRHLFDYEAQGRSLNWIKQTSIIK